MIRSFSQNYVVELSTSRKLAILAVLIIFSLISIRFLYLDADPPSWYIPEDPGFYIDEGYKTLSPKNLYLYGRTHWNLNDDYNGWMNSSPFTQWSYYAVFKAKGLHLSNVRALNVIYFSLFLVITAVFLFHRLNPKAALLGVSLIALDPALFQFSRSAIFETPLYVLMYCGLFLTAQISQRKPIVGSIVLCVLAIIVAFTVKMSALLYFFPAAVIAICAQINWSTLFQKSKLRYNGPIALFLILLVTYFFIMVVMERVDVMKAIAPPHKIIFSPIYILSPFALFVANLVLIDILRSRPNLIIKDPYLLILATIVIVTPICLTFFDKNPARYSVPIIPATLLLVAEWFSIKSKLVKKHNHQYAGAINSLCILLFSSALLTMIHVLNEYVLKNLPFPIGDDPGLTITFIMHVYPLLLLVVGGGILYCFKGKFQENLRYTITKTVGIALLLQLAIAVTIQAATLTNPKYLSYAIQAKIEKIIPRGRSVAGDWAPFLTSQSDIHSLYMNTRFNVAKNVHIVKPDYFIFSNSLNDKKSLEILKNHPNVHLDQGVWLGEYHNNEIYLYKISYVEKGND